MVKFNRASKRIGLENVPSFPRRFLSLTEPEES